MTLNLEKAIEKLRNKELLLELEIMEICGLAREMLLEDPNVVFPVTVTPRATFAFHPTRNAVSYLLLPAASLVATLLAARLLVRLRGRPAWDPPP